MPLYIFKDRGHINILKHKLSTAGGTLISGKALKDALSQLPDWGAERDGTPEEVKQQQAWFETL